MLYEIDPMTRYRDSVPVQSGEHPLGCLPLPLPKARAGGCSGLLHLAGL